MQGLLRPDRVRSEEGCHHGMRRRAEEIDV
jgi:hypothetical protein